MRAAEDDPGRLNLLLEAIKWYLVEPPTRPTKHMLALYAVTTSGKLHHCFEGGDATTAAVEALTAYITENEAGGDAVRASYLLEDLLHALRRRQ
ncbi:hypothetical protein Sp245p_28995 (plasmid) [Azospirillum baldaniorum]|uniref:Uncharacterized protein n=1 Tax=Azospirillum baldaniorum TaxID=1064539 RepID=A0A9P1JY23_9PROT|nr:hypothetical protein [Azospirillum baldaniorum]AWJ93859.1 hypothetical protein Sp245p_28995 [Azospirillum baldaniorum]TWA81684.1 hypothetical protein FBZ85_10258 [Azospirillum brasilense]CCD02020.1 protein of unknown function [Azospirillum baldaniorum]